jgi:hypothetical protein
MLQRNNLKQREDLKTTARKGLGVSAIRKNLA